jgi:glycosyltransferase involved in cell wall biosynthesis
MNRPGPPARPWVVVTDYPRWPSPYFTHLHRHVSARLPLAFRPGIDGLESQFTPGVLNLHRLKRLYHDPAAGARIPAAAARFLEQLSRLQALGWRIAWSVHNLYPIDGRAGIADYTVTDNVLARADMLLCHTRSDAAALRKRTSAKIRVTGWTGLEPASQPPSPPVAALVARMRQAPVSFLLAGHMTAYKDVPAAVAAFLESTRIAHLAVAGSCTESAVTAELDRLAAASAGRVSVLARRYAPEQAGHLYAAAQAAVCPYRSEGPFGYFESVLHPSSVGTATGFGVPVIAPDLPAISEITTGKQRWLAPLSAGGLAQAMADAEEETLGATSAHGDSRQLRPPGTAANRWRRIADIYEEAARDLLVTIPEPTPKREASGA